MTAREHPSEAQAPIEPSRNFVRYDLLTWANIVALYRAYPGYSGPESRMTLVSEGGAPDA